LYRLADSSKTGQIKDELFQLQQKARDRENELQSELEKGNRKFQKSQERIPHDSLIPRSLFACRTRTRTYEAALVAISL
jgi:hypothetical protein